MTLNADGKTWRLAPDAAPGSPHFDNILPFEEPETPMPCHADTADMVTEQETQHIEQLINGAEDGEAKTLLQRLVFTVRTLHRELRFTREERDQLLYQAEQEERQRTCN